MPSTPNLPANPGGLTALIQGLDRPLYPAGMINQQSPAMQKWIRDLTDYLRRLGQIFTPGNIIQTINPTVTGFLVDWRYNTTTHTFQIKTMLATGVVSAWTDAPNSDQPVAIAELVEELTTSGGFLADISIANVYVLEKGSESTLESACGCSTISGGGGGGGGGGADCVVCNCAYSLTSTATVTVPGSSFLSGIPMVISGVPYESCGHWAGAPVTCAGGDGGWNSTNTTVDAQVVCAEDGTLLHFIYTVFHGGTIGPFTVGDNSVIPGTTTLSCAGASNTVTSGMGWGVGVYSVNIT